MESTNLSIACRKFKLRLSSRKGLFSDALGVTSVGADGEIRRKDVKTQHFLTGEIQGEWMKKEGGAGVDTLNTN